MNKVEKILRKLLEKKFYWGPGQGIVSHLKLD